MSDTNFDFDMETMGPEVEISKSGSQSLGTCTLPMLGTFSDSNYDLTTFDQPSVQASSQTENYPDAPGVGHELHEDEIRNEVPEEDPLPNNGFDTEVSSAANDTTQVPVTEIYLLEPEDVKTWINLEFTEQLSQYTGQIPFEIISGFLKSPRFIREFQSFLQEKLHNHLTLTEHHKMENLGDICKELTCTVGTCSSPVALQIVEMLLEPLRSNMNSQFSDTHVSEEIVDSSTMPIEHCVEVENDINKEIGSDTDATTTENSELQVSSSANDVACGKSMEISVVLNSPFANETETNSEDEPNSSILKVHHSNPQEVAAKVMEVPDMEVLANEAPVELGVTMQDEATLNDNLSTAYTAMNNIKDNQNRHARLKAAGKFLLRKYFTDKELREGNMGGRKSQKNLKKEQYDPKRIEEMSNIIGWLLENPMLVTWRKFKEDSAKRDFKLHKQDWDQFRYDILVHYAGSFRPKIVNNTPRNKPKRLAKLNKHSKAN